LKSPSALLGKKSPEGKILKAMKQNGFFQRTPRSLLIFYVLVIYVFLQFCWWYFLLFELNTEIYHLQELLAIANGIGGADVSAELVAKLSQKRMMIFGEGFVFLLLLSLGLLQTRSSFRRETQAANQQRNFLLSVTHELKSPLASVKLYLQTLSKRDLERSKQLELLEKAIEEANRLDRLVENMLVAARIDNHAFHLAKEDLNLSKILVEIITTFETRSHCQIKRNIDEDAIIHADAQAIHSIVSNLLENAIKYSNDQPTIEINLSVTQSFVELQVKDQGIGVLSVDKTRIFDKFFRAGNEDTRKTKGTGLGLFIVNYLVAQHGGQIQVLDNQPRGTIFNIRFNSL
jgi:two-component system, OmpR family, phosphate regulon sensor histidine kinase PhoR